MASRHSINRINKDLCGEKTLKSPAPITEEYHWMKLDHSNIQSVRRKLTDLHNGLCHIQVDRRGRPSLLKHFPPLLAFFGESHVRNLGKGLGVIQLYVLVQINTWQRGSWFFSLGFQDGCQVTKDSVNYYRKLNFIKIEWNFCKTNITVCVVSTLPTPVV